MVQVLKEEIRDRIYQAALKIFYEKDFRSARMKDISGQAGVPIGLLYSYYKNKAALFDEIVAPIYADFEAILKKEDLSGLPYEKYIVVQETFFLSLIDNHQKFVILMDKSQGTLHENAKEKLIQILETHITIGLVRSVQNNYDEMLIHILASNFVEGILEIARHYKGREWAKNMLFLLGKCYYEGVGSL